MRSGGRFVSVVFALVIAVVVFATQASARPRAELTASVLLPFSASLSCTETGHGQDNPDGSVVGIVGQGAFALTTTVKPVPVLRAATDLTVRVSGGSVWGR